MTRKERLKILARSSGSRHLSRLDVKTNLIVKLQSSVGFLQQFAPWCLGAAGILISVLTYIY
jgi:hypothetical protein